MFFIVTHLLQNSLGYKVRKWVSGDTNCVPMGKGGRILYAKTRKMCGI